MPFQSLFTWVQFCFLWQKQSLSCEFSVLARRQMWRDHDNPVFDPYMPKIEQRMDICTQQQTVRYIICLLAHIGNDVCGLQYFLRL